MSRELRRVEGARLGRPDAACHASTLALTPSGAVCAWFGGPHEGARETAIWWSLRGPGGWSEPALAADVGPEPHWNPVLHAAPDALLLFFKVGIYPKRWRTFVTRCPLDDLGAWAPPVELVPGDVGGRGPVKNKLLVSASGAWLAPASLERDAGWDCFVDRSVDGGATWEASELVPLDRSALSGPGIIQPALWSSAPNQVHLLARSSEGCLLRADSSDDGRTWSPARPTSVPNNNSGIDLVAHPDGRLVLACNPVAEPWGPRTPLVLLGSDAGARWERLHVLEDGPGEFSYPAVIADGDRLLVSYTWNRSAIAVVELEVP